MQVLNDFYRREISVDVYFKDGKDTTLTTDLLKKPMMDYSLPVYNDTLCYGDTLWIDPPEYGFISFFKEVDF